MITILAIAGYAISPPDTLAIDDSYIIDYYFDITYYISYFAAELSQR